MEYIMQPFNIEDLSRFADISWYIILSYTIPVIITLVAAGFGGCLHWRLPIDLVSHLVCHASWCHGMSSCVVVQHIVSLIREWVFWADFEEVEHGHHGLWIWRIRYDWKFWVIRCNKYVLVVELRDLEGFEVFCCRPMDRLRWIGFAGLKAKRTESSFTII